MSRRTDRRSSPTYDLDSFKAAYSAGEASVLTSAYQSAFEIGLLPPDIAAAVARLESRHFVRSERVMNTPAGWDDVYKLDLEPFDCELAFSSSVHEVFVLKRFAVRKERRVKPRRLEGS